MLFHVLMTYTLYGKRCYAIGSNEAAARMSGINVDRHKVLVYAIAGLLAAVAAILLTSKNLTAQAGMGVMYELDAIAMAVIGGVSLAGRARVDPWHRAWGGDLFGHHLGFHLDQARRLLPGDGEGRDHRRRRGAGPMAATQSGRGGRPMSKIILETRGLTKHYGGVHALDDANFILHEGEHVAVVGDNGAGKSTFVRQITAVEQRTSGEIFFDGRAVHFAGPLEAREAGIETVFQTLALADDLDVPSNLFLGRELFKFRLGPFSLARPQGDARPARWRRWQTTAVKIPNVDNPIRNMSGGQRQCVAIARTAAFASKLVIMDEPTAALGVQETAQVENIIRGLKDRGIPMILISHNLRQVFDLVDRIVVFRRGRIVASLRKDETDGNDIVSYITGVKGASEAAYA